MNFGFSWRTPAGWMVLAALSTSLVKMPAQTDGVFADFTTSLGNFTCQLDYTNAPRTVANFIGLATGQRAWLDLPTGVAKTSAFYNGLTFHRVISSFIIQGGSPNGLGTDDPGYAFEDEFSPFLTFSNAWMLAMANSGPNSDGAQFFVTVAPFTSGNNTYTVFGWVVSGTNTVNAIDQVATDANDKPLTNVVIQQVSVRRLGAAAQAFDINAWGLPVVTNLPLRISKGAGSVTLIFSNRPYADNRLYSTTNLNSWTANGLGIEITPPSSNTVQSATSLPQCFYRFAQVQYASSTFAPKSVYGRTLSLTFTSGGSGTLTINFDSVGGGTFTFPPGPNGTVSAYVWNQEPYRGRLLIALSGYPVLNLRCDFSASNAGTFAGTAYPNYPSSAGAFPVAGTLTLAGP